MPVRLRRMLRTLRARLSGPGRRLHLDGGRGEFVLLLLTPVLIMIGIFTVGTTAIPLAAYVLPLVLGVLFLRLRRFRILLLVVAAATLISVLDAGLSTARGTAIILEVVVAAISYSTVRSRESLGVVGTRGDVMLGELRDTLLAAPNVAALPPQWGLELAYRTAGGSAFGGDFLVSCRVGDTWELALVDVSGKGVEAGTRALQLSGAFGGILGSVPPEEFPTRANDYLLRQEWMEGFATAAHLTLDTTTGRYAIRSAGHPPAARFHAATGEWELAEATGPALGLLPGAQFAPAVGRLGSGDALLLYTDGLVEVPGRDLSVGIDRLLGEANRLILRGFDAGAERLIRSVAPTAADDRAAVLLWRR